MFGALSDAFLKNRAEQLDDDVTGYFIVPPFLARAPIGKSRQSMLIQGGRGCGKTIFLRAFCFPTTFSSRRPEVPVDALSSVGLYWKPDIGFCSLMRDEWLGPGEAAPTFLHYTTLVVLSELCRAADVIAQAQIEGGKLDLRDVPLPEELEVFVGPEVRTLRELSGHCRRERARLDLWVQNPRTVDRPRFLRLDSLMESLAEHLAAQDPRLRDLFFRIFIDEFESLRVEQRRLMCDAIKQPGRRFSVNFAMRRHAVTRFETTGSEQLTEIHDYRAIDIEEELAKNDDFFLLAAEFMLLRLAHAGVPLSVPCFDPTRLFSPEHLKLRLNARYREAVIDAARRILPTVSAPEVARSALQDEALRGRVIRAIDYALSKRGSDAVKAADFVREDEPAATIVAACVLNRRQPEVSAVYAALHSVRSDARGDNPFTRSGGWVDNNLYGALFYLYLGLPARANPLYAGFDRYCKLARLNMRYFVQLCYAALQRYDAKMLNDGEDTTNGQDRGLSIAVDDQGAAARDVSEHFLREVERSGGYGERLHQVALRLGRIFEMAQSRRAQSEPEINHFSIDEGKRHVLLDETNRLIREAKVQSVLYEEKDTKNKMDHSQVLFDLIPNPMFSPYFGISYRKRRKLTLRPEEANIIFCGSGEQFSVLLGDFRRRWGLHADDDSTVGSSGSLF